MPLFAEGQRRLDAQAGIGIAQQLGERDGDVHVGHRQQLERAAEDVEVVMLVAQRRDERGEQVARGVPGQPLDRGAPDLPAVVAERVGEGLRRVQGVDGLQALGGAAARLGVVALEIGGERALGVEPRRHVLDRRHHADHAIPLPQRPERDELLHALEVRGRRAGRARDQVVVERGRQHLRLAALEHAREAVEHPACAGIRDDVRQRAAARGGRGNARGALEPLAPRANGEGGVDRQHADRQRLGRRFRRGRQRPCALGPPPFVL